MDPFRILGLASNAETREVKRAYARLLKTHRPDEDPAGFQRIHEAYEACLQHIQWRSEWQDEEAEDIAPGHDEAPDPAPTALESPLPAVHFPVAAQTGQWSAPPDPSPAWRIVSQDIPAAAEEPPPAPPEDEAFDAQAFIAALRERMLHGQRDTLAWLERDEALYSIHRKHALRGPVTHMLSTLERLPDAMLYDEVLGFFGLQGITDADWWMREQLHAQQARLHAREALERQLAQTRARSWTDRQLVDELRGPKSWWRRVLLMGFVGLPGRVNKLHAEIVEAFSPAVDEWLDGESIQWWQGATDRSRFARPRLAVIGIRLGLVALVLAFFGWMDYRVGTPFAEVLAKGAPWFAAAAGAWAAWALFAFVVIRFRSWAISKGFDPVQALAVAFIAACMLGFWAWPGIGNFVFALLCFLWLGSREDGSKWGTIASMFFAGMFGMSVVMENFAADGVMQQRVGMIALGYAMALLVVHDALYTRIRRVGYEQVRHRPAWLWWIAAFNAFFLLLDALHHPS